MAWTGVLSLSNHRDWIGSHAEVSAMHDSGGSWIADLFHWARDGTNAPRHTAAIAWSAAQLSQPDFTPERSAPTRSR